MASIDQTSPKENFLIWGVKIFAGLFIIVLLGIHFVINHLVAPGGLLTYADVLDYYQKPVIPIMEILFLIFVVVHALLGLRSILLDLRLPARFTRLFDPVFWAAGIVMIAYGAWLVIKVVQAGSSG